MKNTSLLSFNTSMVKSILLLTLSFISLNATAQKDAIYLNEYNDIRCKILKVKSASYTYAFIGEQNNVVISKISKTHVDSIQFNKYDNNMLTSEWFDKRSPNIYAKDDPLRPYQFTIGVGLNVGNILEFNSPSGSDKKSFSTNFALDLAYNYYEDRNRYAMTNELHWTMGVQQSGGTSESHIQRTSDVLSTLHDFSYALNKTKKWNFNVIAKTNTSVFTIFEGDYFKDYEGFGKIQAFLNPYEVTISPGLKFQPNKNFRFSLSPFSINLYGLTNQQIANTGYYTQSVDEQENYELFVYEQLGAQVNIWYDKKVKKWLEMQYRLGISSDNITHIVKNGLMDGLFITKVKLIKNIYLTHRAVLKGDFSQKTFKPFYSQTILISFAKSF